MAKNSAYYKEKKQKEIDDYLLLQDRLPGFAIQFLNSKHKLTQSSKNLYAKDLITFFSYILDADENLFGKDVKAIQLSDIAMYTAELFDAYVDYLRTDTRGNKRGNNRTSANHKLIVLCNLYQHFSDDGLLPRNPLARYEGYKEPSDKIIVHLTNDEVSDVLNSVTHGVNIPMTNRMQHFYEKTKQRDIAIIKLFLGTGIRVSELVGADVNDLNFRDNLLYVVRKGEHADAVYFNDDVAQALSDYIGGERKILKKENEEPLFYSLRGQRISVDTVERIVKRYTADVYGKNITPHKLRSTYGTALYSATHDLALTQDALGHSSPETTKQYYVNSREENMKRAGETKIY